MGLVMTLNMAAVGLNTVLLLVLISMYVRILREVPSRFTWGLLVFAGVFLVQQVTQLYFFVTMMAFYVPGIDWIVLSQNGLTTLALLFLVFVTWAPTGGFERDRPTAESS